MVTTTVVTGDQVPAPNAIGQRGQTCPLIATLVGTNSAKGTPAQHAPEQKTARAIRKKPRETIQWEAG